MGMKNPFENVLRTYTPSEKVLFFSLNFAENFRGCA